MILLKKYSSAFSLLLFCGLFFLFSNEVKGQELIIEDFPSQAQTRAFHKNSPSNVFRPLLTAINLPFFDDFSVEGKRPDTTKWLYVSPGLDMPTITLGKSIHPLGKGAATFDGSTYYNDLYAFTFLNGQQDILETRLIDLSSFSSTNNLALLFFLEPGGNADPPENTDTFYVDFWDSNTGGYVQVAAISGDSIPQNRFSPFLVPIQQNGYFNDSFQVRFTSYGSLNGEKDVWHLDYVRIEENLTLSDTVVYDQGLVNAVIPPFDGFSAIPWFMTAGIGNWWGGKMEQVNLSNTPVTGSFTGLLTSPEPLNGQVLLGTISQTSATIFSAGNQWREDSIPPFTSQIFSAPALVQIKYSNSFPGTQFSIENDGLILEYPCDSILAYDDGEADVAYGLNSNRAFAQRFTLPNTLHDTLSAVWIKFIPSVHYNSSSGASTPTEALSFKLGIWNEASGTPDTLMAIALAGMLIDYGATVNAFVRYSLSSPIEVPSVFYVGIWQNDAIPVAVGFDKNLNHQNEVFYQNTTLNWVNTSYQGTLMFRPEFESARVPGVGIDKMIPQTPSLNLFPNPSNENSFFITFEKDVIIEQISITDLNGKSIWIENGNGSGTSNMEIEIPVSLSPGLYFVVISGEQNGNKVLATRRWIYQP